MAATTKKKPKPASRSQQRFTRQARDEAFLRFNPERSSLRGALQDAADTLEQTIGTARGSARGVQQAARESIPQFRSVYGQAQSDVGQGEKDLLAATAGSPIAPAAARDATGAQRRLAESLSGALAEAENRQTEAQSGASFAINQAQSQYGRNVDRIQTRMGDLSAEEGRYVSGRLGELLGDQAKRAFDARQKRADRSVTRRGQTLSHEDRVAAQKAKAKSKSGSTLPGGVKPRETTGQASFRTAVTNALNIAKPRAGTYTRREMAQLLLSGREKSSALDDEAKFRAEVAKNNAKPRDQRESVADIRRRHTVTIPALPKFEEAAVTAALDIAYDGHLSPATVAKLHTAGIKVKPMGLTTNRKAPRPRGVKGGPVPRPRGANKSRPSGPGSTLQNPRVQPGVFPPIDLRG